MRMHHVGWAVAVLLAASGAARAGRSCENKRMSTAEVTRAMELAERTVRQLDASGAQVVALARVGQDLSRWNQHYSHFGWAYREAPPAAPGLPGTWRIVHKLNHCGTDRAEVYRQGPGEFFLDRLHAYESAYVVPEPAVQQRLLAVLRDNGRAARWHTRSYSMLAYPWARQYQQSNQWALETLAGAMDDGATDRSRAQGWLRLRGYEPDTLRVDAFHRLGARLTRANVAFDDHPFARRFTDRIDTVTVDSVFAWLQRSGLAGHAQPVR
ncbi:MAG: DUF2145 domain-containing protein [Aquabacterium sp.]|nr:MAG: DUF2145 domain-containing protein [Aquabacterium sp.]